MTTAEAVGPSSPGPVRVVLARYEAVFAFITAVVLLVRLGGGAFVMPAPFAPPARVGVTPFANATATQSPNDAPGATTAGSSTAAPRLTATTSTPGRPSTESGATPPAASGEALGTASPFATLDGPGLASGIAVTATGEVWVGTDEPGGGTAATLYHFSPDGTAAGTMSIPDAKSGTTAVAISSTGLVFAASRTPAAVFVIDPTSGSVARYADIPDVSPCLPALVTTSCDGSAIGAKPLIASLAFDRSGDLFAADSAQGAIWRISPNHEVQQWLVEPTWVNPVRPSGPTGLAFDGGGNLVVTVASTLTDDAGLVFLQHVAPNGAPGDRAQLANTGAGSRAIAVALGVSGTMFVALSGSGRIVLLDPTGRTIGSMPDASAPALDALRGIAFQDQSLLAVGGARVTRLSVGEAGGHV